MSSAWYHGSPLELEDLVVGSTITQDRDIARVFSHKPTLVSRDDNGRIQHNGLLPGFLYEVEDVSGNDVYPHPGTTMDPGVEWITKRELHLRGLEPTTPRPEELLTDAQVRQLIREKRGT